MIRNGMMRLANYQQLQLVNKNFTRPLSQSDKAPYSRLELSEVQKRKYPQVEQEFTEEGFPILKLEPRRRNIFNQRKVRERSYRTLKARETAMPENQDWPSVWPTAKTFVPSSVPMPIRQGYHEVDEVPRAKYVNTELLKITNFLHLTPEAIRRQCAALRKFCTKWPDGLESDNDVRFHFPVTHVTRDYCHSSPTIRDERARVVQLIVNINDLKLKGLDRIKLIELARHRYNPNTEELTINASACPMRLQNCDYAEYLLSALYFESQEHQEWEKDRVEEKDICLDEYRRSVEQKLGFDQVAK